MTDTLTAPGPPDVDYDVFHGVCSVCWPNHATEPHQAMCGQWLAPGPLLDDLPAGGAVCPLCAWIAEQPAACGHE